MAQRLVNGLQRAAMRLLPSSVPLFACKQNVRGFRSVTVSVLEQTFVRLPRYWCPPLSWRVSEQRRRPVTNCSSEETRQTSAGTAEVRLDILVEEEPLPSCPQTVPDLVASLQIDGKAVVQEAVRKLWLDQGSSEPPRPVEVSVVLSDDAYIAQLNEQYRGVEGPTDVLSFALQDDEDDDAPSNGYPYTVLGDIIISLETAERQAKDRGHGLLDEVRILLVHGVLHLLGYDHEQGGEEQEEMQAEEQRILGALGWHSDGLIAAAFNGSTTNSSSNGNGSTPQTGSANGRPRKSAVRPDVRILALDMDGTLLNSSSQVLPSSVDAIRAALGRGVMVCLATGKARVAAIKAMDKVGLAGDGLVVSTRGPGIFLQGLAVYGDKGQMIKGASLSPALVEQAFRYSQAYDMPLCAFLGDSCATLKMTPELEELHSVYYEPLADVAGSVEDILAGYPVKKLLFMTSPELVEQQLKPMWQAAAQAEGGSVMQAVPNMLEVVPRGMNKWVGAQALLQVLGLPRESLMAIGDGGNDFELVSEAGLGIAMGNAVDQVKAAADFVVSSNDDDGIAEAIERFVL